MDNKEYILSKYTIMKNWRHPLDGSSYSKQKRIIAMTYILTDDFRYNNFSNEDKLLANKCIEMILNEQDNDN